MEAFSFFRNPHPNIIGTLVNGKDKKIKLIKDGPNSKYQWKAQRQDPENYSILGHCFTPQKKAILADGFCVMIWLRPLVVKLEVKSESAQFMHEYIE